jgi:hypothetical protein
LGRVVFTGKAEPGIDWLEIESRLQDISNSSQSSCDVPIEPAVTLANDPPALIGEQPAAATEPSPSPDTPATAKRDPFDMLSLPAAFPSNQS